jgi:hypothetical protein
MDASQKRRATFVGHPANPAVVRGMSTHTRCTLGRLTGLGAVSVASFIAEQAG